MKNNWSLVTSSPTKRIASSQPRHIDAQIARNFSIHAAHIAHGHGFVGGTGAGNFHGLRGENAICAGVGGEVGPRQQIGRRLNVIGHAGFR